MQVTYTITAVRWWRHGSAQPKVCYLACLALSALRWWWAGRHLAHYLRWREGIVAAMSILMLAPPFMPLVVSHVAGELWGFMARQAGTPGWWLGAHILCPAFLAFTSHTTRLAVISLGFRVRLPLHAALHLAMLVRAQAHALPMCQAVVSGAGPGFGESLPGVQELYTAFSAFLLFLGHIVPLTQLPAHRGALEQCQCVVSMLQIAVGFLLPLAVHVVWESTEYSSYCNAHPATREGNELLAQVYERVARLSCEMTYVEVAVIGVWVLGAVWLLIVASVPGAVH
jgi:hypothetical protein